MSKVDSFLDHLERRLNIHVVQQILRESELISARSWSELKMIVKSAANLDATILDRLKTALIMQQLCDLKAVSFYEVTPSAATLIGLKLNASVISPTNLSASFPIDASEAVLSSDNGQLKPIFKYSDNFGSGIVLSRRREFTVSNEIKFNSFSPEMKKQFPKADKIIEVKSYNKQTYDVIYLNKAHGILEIRADVTREDGQQQTAGQLNKSVDDLRAYASGFVSSAVKGYDLGLPVNLLPLTKKVYEDGSGAIKKIGFATEEESVKRETMKAGVDLRSELFHKTGAKAIDHKMSIFEVAIQWHGSDVVGGISGSKPEIHIPGSYRDYTKTGARTDYLFVKGVRTYADANFIIEKLKSYK
jgi:hypothetical protein